MNIGVLAEKAGLPTKTIRYYESIGLLAAPSRRPSGYRDYQPSDVEVLRFLRRARSLGFSVEQCRELLSLYRNQDRASADVRAIARAHLREMDEKIRRLEQMKSDLEALVARCSGDGHPECPIMEALAGAEPHCDDRHARHTARRSRGAAHAVRKSHRRTVP